MAGSAPNIVLRKGTWYLRKQIPADVRAIIGKSEMWVSLKTGDFQEAKKAAVPHAARIDRNIAEVRRKLAGGSLDLIPARLALAAWAEKERSSTFNHFGDTTTEWAVMNTLQLYERISNDPEVANEHPEFDEALAGVLRSNGCRVQAGDPIITAMRQEAALVFAFALRQIEKMRIYNAHLRDARAALNTPLEEIGTVPTKPVVARPAPSLTLSSLYQEWKASAKANDKQAGRLDHQMRRMIEFMGDVPANYVDKKPMAEFMGWVVRFPGRKRTAELNALPMKALVERFEALNAALVAKDQEPMQTLTKATVEEWFGGYRRMFDYGVAMDMLENNPCDGIRKIVVKGAKSVKRRHFEDDEIIKIFSAPVFTGYDPKASSRFREVPGSTVTRDAKFWLPILSLFHGGRLTEIAAMPLADLKQTNAGTWYFDLTIREVKNETSQRQIPMHPTMKEIGFLDYVADLRAKGEKWLFPDLDHDSRHGAGHEFSKFWGLWMDKHDMPDPTITHHSWRHSWKRCARESPVKAELHDVISGHAPQTVGGEYGRGAAIEVLAKNMALIEFPVFPKAALAARGVQ